MQRHVYHRTGDSISAGVLIDDRVLQGFCTLKIMLQNHSTCTPVQAGYVLNVWILARQLAVALVAAGHT